ncbi:McrB family protein [Mammaliicoccus lentus]|uniref:McrB family protein n=1 Tax=Mammaliicoccus lentus TaxID=42858 RepID=UPI00374EFE76
MHYKWEKVDLIGVLASSEDIRRVYDKENIFINNEGYIQFYIKLISTTPYDYPDQNNRTKYISCFSSRLTPFYKDEVNKSDEERIEDFLEYIRNKFVLLNVEQKEDHTILNKYYYNGHVKEILPQYENFNNNQTLHPVPLFNSEISAKSFEEFLEDLRGNKKVGNIKNLSSESEDLPQYLFYSDEKLNIYVVGEINSYEYSDSEGFSYEFNNELKYIKLDDEDFKNLIKTDNNIAYISTQLSLSIEERLNKEKNNIMKKTLSDKEEIELQEEKFLKYFFKVLKNEKLIYREKDILNFHTAMKSSNLVILSGMSGTGKSKLVKAYAEALNLKDGFKFIPVSPSWTDDSDIIGYADTLNMIYRPDDYGLIETLLNAKEEPSKLHIICFDEMNLARIEHYFSQFLSLLESDVENRKLRLYNKELGGKLYNSSKYKYEIPIGKNVYFVGTANVDDTTYHFSNKVLDRANLITLKVMPFEELVKISRTEKINALAEDAYNNEYVDKFYNSNKTIELDIKVIEFLQELHNLLMEINSQSGIGPRVIRQIDSYIKNIPKNEGVLNENEALDLQIVQRILSKVRGSREELSEYLGIYDSISNNLVSSTIINLLDKYKDISDFEESRNLIFSKAKELYLNGYTF